MCVLIRQTPARGSFGGRVRLHQDHHFGIGLGFRDVRMGSVYAPSPATTITR